MLTVSWPFYFPSSISERTQTCRKDYGETSLLKKKTSGHASWCVLKQEPSAAKRQDFHTYAIPLQQRPCLYVVIVWLFAFSQRHNPVAVCEFLIASQCSASTAPLSLLDWDKLKAGNCPVWKKRRQILKKVDHKCTVPCLNEIFHQLRKRMAQLPPPQGVKCGLVENGLLTLIFKSPE